MNQQKYYLGVDGGGTSTTAAVADGRGRILGTGEAGPSLYKVVGLMGAAANMRTAILAAEKKAHLKSPSYTYSVLGLSGVDSMKDWKLLSELVFKNFKSRVSERFRVVNDVVIALAAGTTARYGAAVIAGTGSNAYAGGQKGEAYASGVGSLLADEGSAYWIGCQMLRAVVKSFDGRGKKTRLEQLLCTRLGVQTVRDIVDVVYRGEFDKTAVAQLAPLCAHAARRGDREALRILHDAARELADMVNAVIRRSGLQGTSFEVVRVGGVWRAGSFISKPFERRVRALAPHARFVQLRSNPVRGAVRLAWEYGAQSK